jgi:chemotaxis methyl-accepting protein methylase
MDATMIEPEQLAQAMVDRLKEDDLREYVFEDLTEIYTDLKHDNQSEYQDVIDQLYPQDV